MVPEADKPLFHLMFGEIDVDVAIGLVLDNPGLWESAAVEITKEKKVEFVLKMHSQYINRLHRHFMHSQKDKNNPKMSWARFSCPTIYEEAFLELEKEN